MVRWGDHTGSVCSARVPRPAPGRLPTTAPAAPPTPLRFSPLRHSYRPAGVTVSSPEPSGRRIPPLSWTDGTAQTDPGHLRLRGTRARRSFLVRGAGLRASGFGMRRSLGCGPTPVLPARTRGQGRQESAASRRAGRYRARGCTARGRTRGRMRTTGRARRGTSAATARRRTQRVVPRDAGHRGQRVLSRPSDRAPPYSERYEAPTTPSIRPSDAESARTVGQGSGTREVSPAPFRATVPKTISGK